MTSVKFRTRKKNEVVFSYGVFSKLSNQSDLGLTVLGCCVSGKFHTQGVFWIHLIMKIMLWRSEQIGCHCLDCRWWSDHVCRSLAVFPEEGGGVETASLLLWRRWANRGSSACDPPVLSFREQEGHSGTLSLGTLEQPAPPHSPLKMNVWRYTETHPCSPSFLWLKFSCLMVSTFHSIGFLWEIYLGIARERSRLGS